MLELWYYAVTFVTTFIKDLDKILLFSSPCIIFMARVLFNFATMASDTQTDMYVLLKLSVSEEVITLVNVVKEIHDR